MATVGIVVRTKDRAVFLRRALASITGQTHFDWECVIVNDGGDPAVVDSLVAGLSAADRAKIRTIHSEQSRGRWVSANAGVLATATPLVVLHDDDDTWEPAFLEQAVAYLDANPSQGGIVSRVEIIWERREGEVITEIGREQFQPQLTDPLYANQLLFNRFVPIAFVYRRSLHEEFGLYDEALPVIGDWVFTSKVLAAQSLEFLDGPPLANWHQRVGDNGADGNSVIAASGDHERYDRRIRDAALREYVRENGDGLVLYLTKYIDDRLTQSEQTIRDDMRREFLATTEGRMRNWLGRRVRRRRGDTA